MLWAVACTCFFKIFWTGRVTSAYTGRGFDIQLHLAVSDLAVDNPTDPRILQIHLKWSKTDQFHTGTNVCIGHTGDEICPVAALMAYLAVRGMKQGLLFLMRDEQPLRRGVRYRQHPPSSPDFGIGKQSLCWS